jgi:hypothetical protein
MTFSSSGWAIKVARFFERFGRAFGVARPAFLETAMVRRLAIADRVIAGRLGVGGRCNFMSERSTNMLDC